MERSVATWTVPVGGEMAAHYPNFDPKMPCFAATQSGCSMSPSPAAAHAFSGLLADGVLIVHLAFVLWVMLGGLLVLRWPRLVWLHLPAVAWGIYVELSGRICPLTPLENSLREAAGQTGYSGGCIEHYVTLLIYPDGLSRQIQFALAALVVLVNGTVYWLLVRRRKRQFPTDQG